MKWCIQKFDGNWRYGSSGRAHALQAQRPEFKIQSQQKKKKKRVGPVKAEKSLVDFFQLWCKLLLFDIG
jgi:hypothetical protein